MFSKLSTHSIRGGGRGSSWVFSSTDNSSGCRPSLLLGHAGSSPRRPTDQAIVVRRESRLEPRLDFCPALAGCRCPTAGLAPAHRALPQCRHCEHDGTVAAFSREEQSAQDGANSNCGSTS